MINGEISGGRIYADKLTIGKHYYAFLSSFPNNNSVQSLYNDLGQLIEKEATGTTYIYFSRTLDNKIICEVRYDSGLESTLQVFTTTYLTFATLPFLLF